MEPELGQVWKLALAKDTNGFALDGGLDLSASSVDGFARRGTIVARCILEFGLFFVPLANIHNLLLLGLGD